VEMAALMEVNRKLKQENEASKIELEEMRTKIARLEQHVRQLENQEVKNQ